MRTVDEHRARILGTAAPLPVETIPLDRARGRVLASDIRSRWPVPLFDNSGMDGYAVHGADATVGAELRVVADVPAGSSLDPALGPGQAARIMTGAPVPTDADAVIPLEHTDLGTEVRADAPDRITVTTAPRPGAHIRRAGEDAEAGSVTVAAGTVLGPWQLSSAASAGHDTVDVHRSPRVAVVSTGSELIAPSARPVRGQIPESNSVLLAAAVASAGAEVVAVHTVADDKAALVTVLDGLDVDVVVLSGGASVGAFDVVKAVLDRTGSIEFGPVSMQPGKPQGFGVGDDGALYFCLPGNPVSVAVSFEMFVRPALLALAGRSDVDRPRVTRRAAVGWRTPPGRTQVLPVVLDDTTVRPATSGGSGSHLVSSLAVAQALAIVPADVERVGEGASVEVMVLT
ncbi:molybdopterin molybdotransferase [Gordonia malaquae]|uniref:Molybdopterin molybdenumtransferase n=1 Tax=Gordonia malaquae NBRC 108250 TaxID=1223542 RepID=M3UT95_GORML|nr:gephyrin-like molybdotransferase Glp [Gordonia malaquae]GAC78547.1 molybdopterin biosynthesis protein MoeA [Gordonia malaquae NBRC 108250]SED44605.1 molybdopterin molybdotransferase [Gordonia malaquae]